MYIYIVSCSLLLPSKNGRLPCPFSDTSGTPRCCCGTPHGRWHPGRSEDRSSAGGSGQGQLSSGRTWRAGRSECEWCQVRTCNYIYNYNWLYIYVCVYIANTHTPTHTHTRTHTHTHTRTHTHIYTCACNWPAGIYAYIGVWEIVHVKCMQMTCEVKCCLVFALPVVQGLHIVCIFTGFLSQWLVTCCF